MTDRIRNGDLRALARAATMIENRQPEGEALLKALFPYTGRATILGITGSPGAGKSTLVDQLAQALRQQGKQVGIIAVDPTSPYTGGAILGDRIRMQRHHADPGVFIRSMATRGWLGGVARATMDMALLLDAAGRDVVIIETVGVGQDEVEIARLADITVVVLVPNMGDDVQAIKAGLMEIADIFVINKSDQPGADRLEREIRGIPSRAPIVWTVATENKGIDKLLDAIQAFPPADRTKKWALRLREMLRERLLNRISQPELEAAAAQVAAGEINPYSLVGQVSDLSIDHLGIAVRSLANALPFYEMLGLKSNHRETVAAEKVTVAMLPAGDSRIELLEPSESDSVIAKFIDKRGEGLHHVALKVPNLEAAVDRLKSCGARLMNEPRAGAGGHRYVFIHPASTGGVLMELIQA